MVGGVAAAAAAALQLNVFARKESFSRGEAGEGYRRIAISSGSSSALPSELLSRKVRSSATNRYASTSDSLSSWERLNFAPRLNGRRRLWCPRPCSESGIADTTAAESSAEAGSGSRDSSGIQDGPAVLDDEQGSGDVGGDLLEVEENELNVFAAASLLDGIEEKLQQLEQDGKYEPHIEVFQDQPAQTAVLSGGDEKSLLEQVRDIFVFAGPALGIWLSGPLMSLIDTAVIGNSSTLELAALGPGTVICDQTSFVFMFLSIATSNLIATAMAQKDEAEVAGHLSRLLFVSLFCGVGMLLVTEIFATPLLQAFVGVKNYSLVPAARLYVQIRALAWPIVLVGMVAQSASLGMQDSWAPLKVLAIASSVNLIGDILLCTVLGYGIGGAAWATMASQYVGGFLMLKAIGGKGYNPLAISRPSWTQLMYMINLAGPILLTMISKALFYTVITFLATSMGASILGAHQVMIGVFSVCTVVGEPLCQTAQSFMPGLIYGANRNLKRARSLLHTLILIGACLGFTLGCIALSAPWFFPQVFTNDPAIIVQMRSISVPFFLSLMLTPATLACEGTLLAGRDLKFLGLSMASCFSGGMFLLLLSNRLGLGLQGNWWTLVAFQLSRNIRSFSRLAGPKSCLAEEPLSEKGASVQLEGVPN